MIKRLKVNSDTVCWGSLDAATPPVLLIDDGDTLDVDTVSGSQANLPEKGSQFTVLADHLDIIRNLVPDPGPHILTGPVFVRGAEPGDRLIVSVLSVGLRQDWGWNAIEPGFGILPELATEYSSLVIPIDTVARTAATPWGVNAKLNPFFGIMAVAPAASEGKITSVVPGAFGGNMDNKFCGVGSEVHLPVFCDGALFSIGDGHAIQGNGEICDTALETALSGRLHFRVEKGTAPETPEIRTDNKIITMAFNEDLNVAASEASAKAVNLLEQEFGLPANYAYRHCSMFSDLQITQLVNGKKGVHCIIYTIRSPGDPCSNKLHGLNYG